MDERKAEMAALYALGALQGEELAEFERLLASEPELAGEVAACREAWDAFADVCPPVEPPARLRKAVLAAAVERPTNVIPFRWIPWALAAGFAVLGGLAAWFMADSAATTARVIAERDSLASALGGVIAERDVLEVRLREAERRSEEAAVKLASLKLKGPFPDARAVVLGPTLDGDGGATVVALWDPETQTGRIAHHALPPPGQGRDYQLWMISPEEEAPIDAGVLAAEEEFPAMTPSRVPKQIAAFAISLEPTGGSPSPTGPVVYVGEM